LGKNLYWAANAAFFYAVFFFYALAICGILVLSSGF